jgi:uncharacterized protein (TIGR02246 family)
VKAEPAIEAAVMHVVTQFAQAFAERDLDRTLALLAPDPDVVFIGTGADEKRVGLTEIKALLERDFAQLDDISLEIGWHSVSAAGSVAWVTGDLHIQATTAGQETSLQARSTTVLERRGDRWLIIQSHNSLPAAGQEAGQALPPR